MILKLILYTNVILANYHFTFVEKSLLFRYGQYHIFYFVKTIMHSICYTLRLHELCNEKCLFCFQKDEDRIKSKKLTDSEVYKGIIFAYKKWYKVIEFTWWEPLIHKNILKYISFAKKIWFEYIYLQTNWLRLWDDLFATECFKKWANIYYFSMHHVVPDVHDYLVWVKWAFEKSNYWINKLLSLWAFVWIHLVINKYNYKNLKEIIIYFLKNWVSDFVILFPEISWNMLREINNVWVKYSDVIPYVIELLDLFSWLKWRYIQLWNFPICLLKWYEKYIIKNINVQIMNNTWDNLLYIDDRKKHSYLLEKCKKCEYIDECLGVEKLYIDYYWEKEFNWKNELVNKKIDNLNAIDIYIYGIISNLDLNINIDKNYILNIIIEKLDFEKNFLANSLSMNLILSSYNDFENAIKEDISKSLDKLIDMKLINI